MLGFLGGALYDIFCVTNHRGEPFRLAEPRAVISLSGIAAVTAISILIGVIHEEPLFGKLSPFSVTDNAVWMTLTGFALCAFAYGMRGWITQHRGIAFTAVAFAVGAAFPMIFNQSADFVGWGARFAAITCCWLSDSTWWSDSQGSWTLAMPRSLPLAPTPPLRCPGRTTGCTSLSR